MPFDLFNPAGLEAPVGYAHAAKITGGTTVHIAGQAPFDVNGHVVGKGNFVAQFTQVMSNLKTIYVTELESYWNNKKPLGGAYRAVFGKHFPAITLVEVKRLYNPDCMLEISGIAVID
jgi:enamine deaminase RidA (YjgF/YER057c/UK114 family)